jgi:hypothetical protein
MDGRDFMYHTTVKTCTATLGSAPTVTGATSVIINVQDSYGQVSSASATVQINPPPKPTISITSGGVQSVSVNAAIAPVTFKLTGTPPLTISTNSNDVASVTISAGCGTTVMTCTASLGNALGTAGTATLTLTVEDNYVQIASAQATVTETAVATAGSGGGGGGGALDRWTLFGLGGLALLSTLNASRRSANGQLPL